jgi:lipoate-protein ligase A
VVGESRGDAGAFNQRDPEPRRSATIHTVDHPTLVIGSTQPEASVDHRVADSLGVEVVRRRSGGGGVLLIPGEFVWLDLVIPDGDPLWRADVGRAMIWAGELWRAGLGELGVSSSVHSGGMIRSPWSAQVCFAGLGTGEVVATGGAVKLVGISQRRTRHWTRLQTMCHLNWRPELVAALVAAPRPTAAELAPLVGVVTAADSAALADALVANLPAG